MAPRRGVHWSVLVSVITLAGGGHRSDGVDRHGGLFRVLLPRLGPLASENFRTPSSARRAALTLAVGWFAFLAAFGALGSFIFYYRTFAPGHESTGGFPIKAAWSLRAVRDARSRYAGRGPSCSRRSPSASSPSACGSAGRSASRTGRWAAPPSSGPLLHEVPWPGPTTSSSPSRSTSPVILYVVYRAIELLAGRLPLAPPKTGDLLALTAVALVITLDGAPDAAAPGGSAQSPRTSS